MSLESGSGRPAEPAPFPERLGRYEVLIPIASGGMATVYLARSQGMAGFEREVALKLTHGHLRDDPEFVASLIDEARLAGGIRHPNVVGVLDVGEDPHGVFIVMEYVEGDSLANILRALRKSKTRMPPKIALRLLDDVLMGLHAAHELRDENGAQMQVVHRDVTPHNILVGLDGVATLTDFGIAKAITRLSNTSTGLVKGKIAYMSPEQAQGHAIDRRCDVWAAGVVAWEAFAGTRLYDGPNEAAILLKIVREPPSRLRNVCRELPKQVDEAVARALQLNVKNRYESAEAFAQGLIKASAECGLERADRREVAAFLRPLLEAKLRTRKKKVAEIQALRRRMEELTTQGMSRKGATPTISTELAAQIRAVADVVADPLPTLDTDDLVPLEDTKTVPSSPAAALEKDPSEATTEDMLDAPPTESVHLPGSSATQYIGPVSGNGGEREQTGSVGISSMVRSILAPPGTTGGFIVAGAVVGVGLFMVVGLAVVIFRSGPESPATAESASALPQAAEQPAPPVALPPPTQKPTESALLSVEELPPLPSASAAPVKKPRGVPKVVVPRPSPKSTSGTPLSNPYKSK